MKLIYQEFIFWTPACAGVTIQTVQSITELCFQYDNLVIKLETPIIEKRSKK